MGPPLTQDPCSIAIAFAVQHRCLAILDPLPPPLDQDQGPMGLAPTNRPHEGCGGFRPYGSTCSAPPSGKVWDYHPNN